MLNNPGMRNETMPAVVILRCLHANYAALAMGKSFLEAGLSCIHSCRFPFKC